MEVEKPAEKSKRPLLWRVISCLARSICRVIRVALKCCCPCCCCCC